MRNTSFGLIIVGLMLLLDFYVFQAVKVVTSSAAEKWRSIIFIIYWVLSIATLLLFILMPYLSLDNYSNGLRTIVFSVIIAIFFAKFTASVFLLIDDIRRIFQWMAGKIMFSNSEGEVLQEGEGITRSHFLSWLGIATGGGILSSLLYGFTNKYDYQVQQVKLSFQNLPKAFKGLNIVQLSDIHSGSFQNKSAVQKGIKKVLDLKPDLILFTGDLVNNRADEMKDFIDVFSELKAPLGVFSILGNHDYGDYENWKSVEEKRNNLQRLKNVHAQLGWRLLMNENIILEKENEKIALIGVENWSAKARFPKYGKLADAYAGTEAVAFKILLSHDPSHWDAEVRPQYSDIDLMLAGHTHGFQFGVDTPWFRWSPVQYVYKQWAGLYEEGAQKLYVNRGYGFIGYPGRVGVLPEITQLHLV